MQRLYRVADLKMYIGEEPSKKGEAWNGFSFGLKSKYIAWESIQSVTVCQCKWAAWRDSLMMRVVAGSLGLFPNMRASQPEDYYLRRMTVLVSRREEGSDLVVQACLCQQRM